MSIVLGSAPMAAIKWKLRAVMADRKISNATLGQAIGKHPTTVSRLRQRDTLPAIGNEEIEKIRQAITSLSNEFADCKLEDLVELIEND